MIKGCKYYAAAITNASYYHLVSQCFSFCVCISADLVEQPRGVCALSNLSSKFVWFPFKANCIAHPGPACLLVVSTMSRDGQLMSDSYYAEFLLSQLKECCRTFFFFLSLAFPGSSCGDGFLPAAARSAPGLQSKLISGQHILKDSICFDS